MPATYGDVIVGRRELLRVRMDWPTNRARRPALTLAVHGTGSCVMVADNDDDLP